MLASVEPRDDCAPGEVAAMEVRYEPARGTQERRLPAPGEPCEDAELAREQIEADVVQRGVARAGVAVRDTLEREHRAAHRSIPLRAANGSSVAAVIARASATVPTPTGMSTSG